MRASNRAWTIVSVIIVVALILGPVLAVVGSIRF
jgi:hypothetical protein